jgi:hypothetical protein
MLEIVSPVFLGYLGSATTFLFSRKQNDTEVVIKGSMELFSLLVKGPVYSFALILLFVIFAFGYSNRIGAPPGIGMNVDLLAGAISATLGLLAVTTNIVVS